MKVRDSRRARFQLEMLERRETPSAGMGGVALSAPGVVHALVHKPVHVTKTLSGSGVAHLTSLLPQLDGSLLATGALTGSAKPIGAFTGSLQASLDASSATLKSATGIFIAPNGSTLDMSVTVKKGKGTYKITGGTGTYLGAKGTGTIKGSVSVATETLSFSLKGTVIITK